MALVIPDESRIARVFSLTQLDRILAIATSREGAFFELAIA
jgi:hypothetical protein